MSRTAWIIIIGVVASMVAGIFIGRSTVERPEPEVRVEVETIRVKDPLPEVEPTDQYKTLYFALADSSIEKIAQLRDSIEVVGRQVVEVVEVQPTAEGYPKTVGKLDLPMYDYVFTDNEIYRIVVNGYGVTVPEIEINKETVYETKTVTYYPRWRLDAMYSMMYAQEQWQSAMGVCFDRKIFNRLYVGAYAMQGLKNGEISAGVVARFTILKK